MHAMGMAGSSVNLRECVLVLRSEGPGPLRLSDLGHSGLGACELFRPALFLTNSELEDDLHQALEAADVSILCLPL